METLKEEWLVAHSVFMSRTIRLANRVNNLGRDEMINEWKDFKAVHSRVCDAGTKYAVALRLAEGQDTGKNAAIIDKRTAQCDSQFDGIKNLVQMNFWSKYAGEELAILTKEVESALDQAEAADHRQESMNHLKVVHRGLERDISKLEEVLKEWIPLIPWSDASESICRTRTLKKRHKNLWDSMCSQGCAQPPNEKETTQGLSVKPAPGKTGKQAAVAGSQDYTLTLPNEPATDSKGGTLQTQQIDMPSHWDAMPPNTSYHSVTIPPGTEEDKNVLNLLKLNRNVIKIERIQNPLLWRMFQIKKQDMDQRNGRQDNERLLFHGTCCPTVDTIKKEGFNRSYAGKNATCYGYGTYFSVCASYSSKDTYSRPNEEGEKYMFLCRVLTGEFTKGGPNIITPPLKDDISNERYDSVVDNLSNPSMFVVFHDAQAYPEYLITL